MSITYKTINDSNWQWAENYVYASATYLVACPIDRRCQVGMGVFMLGEPRGEKIRFSGEKEITVIGAGSLHFRIDDDKGPCRIGFTQVTSRLIKLTWEL